MNRTLRTERIAIADSYLQALISHDGASVRFHPKAVRFEAGIKTGFSGRHLIRSLNRGPQFRLVSAIRDENWTIDGDDVVVDYVLIAKLFGRMLPPVAIHEIFLIPPSDLRIRRIDVRFRRSRRD